MQTIPLGFEVGTGEPVAVPLAHMAVTGQTQASGKTTTLEALVARADVPALAFVTKRGESAFQGARRVTPYFRERADWVFVDALLAAQLREKNKFLRPWIMKVCRSTRTLAEVQAAVKKALVKARGIHEGVYTQLDAYLDLIVPEVARAPHATGLALEPGLNVVDVSAYSTPMQMLFVQSALDWVNEKEDGVVTIIPEAWEFVPQGKGTPVRASAETLIRKGAGLGNFLWCDSQDMAGVDNMILRGCTVWLIGVQREANEVKRNLANIPASLKRPTAADVAQLGRGQFYACFADRVVKTYVQPTWMVAAEARAIATGECAPRLPGYDLHVKSYVATAATAGYAPTVTRPAREEDPSMCQEHQQLAADVDRLSGELAILREENGRLNRHIIGQDQDVGRLRAELLQLRDARDGVDLLRRGLAMVLPSGPVGTASSVNVEDVVAKVLARIPASGAVVQVTPPEKLRADFQRDEVVRLVDTTRSLPDLQKRIVRLLEASATTDYVSQPTIAQRLGRATGGGSFVDLTNAVKALAKIGFVETAERRGARKALRAKIAEDLAYYQATEGDIEATYQAVLYELASEAAAA